MGIVLNLRPGKTAKGMWDYLRRVYKQENATKRFQLEYEITKYTHHNKPVQEYYFRFMN